MSQSPIAVPSGALSPAQQKLERRAVVIEEWLLKHHPSIYEEQAHLDADTAQRAYWHYGYLMALRDVLNLMNPIDLG